MGNNLSRLNAKCNILHHYFGTFVTGVLLDMAVRDGLMTQDEVNATQAKIRRAKKACCRLS